MDYLDSFLIAYDSACVESLIRHLQNTVNLQTEDNFYLLLCATVGKH